MTDTRSPEGRIADALNGVGDPERGRQRRRCRVSGRARDRCGHRTRAPSAPSPGSSPSPTRRAASARRRRRSTSAPAWPSSATGCWSSTSIPRATPPPASGINARNLEASIYDVILHDVPLEDVHRADDAAQPVRGARPPSTWPAPRSSWCRRSAGSCGSGGRSSRCRDDYDFILIDCPPSLGLLTVNGLAAATEVVVPIQCEYYALEGLGQLLRNVNLVQANLNPALEVSTIILTMYDARTRLAEQVVDEVRQHFGDQGVPQRGAPDGAPLRGAVVRAADHRVRSVLPGRHRLPGAGQGGEWWRAAAGWVGASGR